MRPESFCSVNQLWEHDSLSVETRELNPAEAWSSIPDDERSSRIAAKARSTHANVCPHRRARRPEVTQTEVGDFPLAPSPTPLSSLRDLSRDGFPRRPRSDLGRLPLRWSAVRPGAFPHLAAGALAPAGSEAGEPTSENTFCTPCDGRR